MNNNVKGRWFFKKETSETPFGMTMPGRSYNAHTLRHGFTGHEKESDLAEGIYTTEYRLYDARVGRWLSVDPLFEKYVDMSPYNYCMLNPVMMVDPDGRAPWENQNIRHAKKHAENTGGKYIERENKNGFVDASVQDVYMEGQDVVVELTVYKGTARNDKNIFFNFLQAFDESSVGSIFAEGNSDGANQGTMTSRDWSVGLGVVGLVTALATFGTGPTLVEAVAAVLGALNSVDDITTDCQGETFVTRQFDTKEQKNSARTAKAIVGGACAAVDVNSVYKGIKAADDISTIGVGVSVLDGVVSGVGVKSSIESRED